MKPPLLLWDDRSGQYASRRGALILHPRTVTLRLVVASGRGWHDLDLLSHGEGGVCLHAPLGYLPGTLLEVRVDACGRELRYRGQVLWRRRATRGYQLALAFSSPAQAFQARMVEQLCYIEAYRQRAEADGETLSPDEAAVRWVETFSGDFPRIGAAPGLGERGA